MEIVSETMGKPPGGAAQERLMSDLRALGRDVEDLLVTKAGDMRGKASDVRARLGVALEHVRSTCLEVSRQSTQTAKQAAKKADNVVREHPYGSIGVALGVGFLAGVLILRK